MRNKIISLQKNLSGHEPSTGLNHDSGSLKIEKSDWLNSIDAASYLGVTVETLRNMTSNGQIPYYKLGQRNRYLQYELQNLLLKNKRGDFHGN